MTVTTAPTDTVGSALWALQAYDTTALATVGDAGPHVAGVFFAPKRQGDGIRLVTAMLRNSRKHLEILADPRVALMCSPGNPARWIQAAGVAHAVEDPERNEALYAFLLEHAPGAEPFVRGLPVLPVMIDLTHIKVVNDLTVPPLELDLPAAGPEVR